MAEPLLSIAEHCYLIALSGSVGLKSLQSNLVFPDFFSSLSKPLLGTFVECTGNSKRTPQNDSWKEEEKNHAKVQ